MPTVTQLLRRRLLARVNAVADTQRLPSLNSLRQTERSERFERYRMNRKVIGAFRYGLLSPSGKPEFDRAPDMIRRLKAYQRDRNAEHLIDVANLCEMEFIEGRHAGVNPTDDGQHTNIKQRRK